MNASSDARPIQVRWETDRELQTTYANQVQITASASEFYLVFGELVPPVDKTAPESLTVQPLVRLAIPAGQMQGIVFALQRMWQQWAEAMHKAQEEANARPTQ